MTRNWSIVAAQRLAVFITLSAALLTGISSAQNFRATVQGVITDSTRAAVPGAKVILTNNNTGIQTIKESNVNGQYLFDYVDSGVYTLVAEAAGFSRFQQQNIVVQPRGDVTVNVELKIGVVSETVTVSEAPVAVQFNTTTMEVTIDSKMVTELPLSGRNPFTLAMLDPAVVNRYTIERLPFKMWGPGRVDVGGNTDMKNDLLLDGTPLMMGGKSSYSPPMDAVQQVGVQQNSVDAEFGHSAGGILNVSMKSGTNEVHGSAYYLGVNPPLNAVSNPIARTPNRIRNHVWGVSGGYPILKGKLFGFTAWEQWRYKEPASINLTLPTGLEHTGDFSQSLNASGGLRTIYDPWSTLFDPATGRVTRTAFGGNRIPAARIDPTSLRVMQDVWAPNNPGDDVTGVNNFKRSFSFNYAFWNISHRMDWNISDKWKMFGRYSQFITDTTQERYVDSPAMAYKGGPVKALNIAADTVYTLNQSTLLNFRWGYTSFIEDYDAPSPHKTGEAGLAALWPNNPWYKPYLKELTSVFYPNIAGLGLGSFWMQRAKNYSGHARISRQQGRHYLKAGVEERSVRVRAIVTSPYPMTFPFAPALTADTFISPNTRLRGDKWATMLLGALESSSQARTAPVGLPMVDYYAAYLQDDFKLNRNVTLNLGLRYEYATAPRDSANRLSRYLDPTNPIPEMQSSPPKIPADVAALMKVPYSFSGAWVFTSASHPGVWDTAKTVFLPRAGLALRINDKTALRFGFARFLVPPELSGRTKDKNDLTSGFPLPGYTQDTFAAPVLQGVPAARLSDPFPASNPLILPAGQANGRYTNLGGDAAWDLSQFRSQVSDRINVSLQRQLPAQLYVDVTYFAGLSHDVAYNKSFNMSDPQLSYTYQAALAQTVANPFYLYLTPDKFPGQLRNQAMVTKASLLVPFPQYGALVQNTPGVLDRYHALQIKAQRAFNRGTSFLVAYNYNRQRTQAFFNSDDQYVGGFTFQPSNNPRHRMTVAGIYELPFGRGRALLPKAHPIVNAFLGGWQSSVIFSYNSGEFLRFGQMIIQGSPRISNPTRDRYFDTSMFQRPLPYTPRTNPLQYPGVTGPRFVNFDAAMSKTFPITERFKLEFRMESFNLTNSFMAGTPNTDVNSSLFGRSTTQSIYNSGRRLQYSARVTF